MSDPEQVNYERVESTDFDNLEADVGPPLERFEYVAWPTSAVTLFGSAYMVIYFSSMRASISELLISIYMLLLSLVGLMARCRIPPIVARLPFLLSGTGCGLFYIFIGALALPFGVDKGSIDEDDVPFFIGLMAVVCGSVCVTTGCVPYVAQPPSQSGSGNGNYGATAATPSPPAIAASDSSTSPLLQYKPDTWAQAASEHSCLAKARLVMTWVNCIFLIAGGIYTAVWRAKTPRMEGAPKRALSAYMAFFGIFALLYQMQVRRVVQHFQLLHSASSRGFFFIAVGGLGWCEGWQIGGHYADLVMILTGAVSIATGVLCIVSRMRAVVEFGRIGSQPIIVKSRDASGSPV